jgi:hypothetical protein
VSDKNVMAFNGFISILAEWIPKQFQELSGNGRQHNGKVSYTPGMKYSFFSVLRDVNSE